MALLEELAAALPQVALVTDPDRMEAYRRDRTTWVDPGVPQAVVLPTTTAEVAAAVRVAAAHRTPVLARGAGSSLAGGASATDGCLVVCLERMDRILELVPEDQLAVVEPGVINSEVSEAAGAHGLFYPPDPASRTYSTIGGNVATNAGGLCCVKYGVTRDHVLGLEVVLADGRVIRTGRRTVKGVAGLDLTGLFVGSEGTLGIVTRATLRLRTAPQGAATLVAFFGTLGDAGRAVTSIVSAGLGVSLLEIMDRASIAVVEKWRHLGLDPDAAALLVVQSDEPVPLRAQTVERAAELCDRAGATYTAFTDDPDDADALLEARRLVGTAIDGLGATVIHEDLAVPRSRIPEMIGRIEELSQRHGVQVITFGHAGDGNLHPALVADDRDAGLEDALVLFDAMVRVALDLGGTVTGEHGIGRIKPRFLADELGSDNLSVQRAVTDALDPAGVFAPNRWT